MTDDDDQTDTVPAWCRLDDDEAELRREWMEAELLDDLETLEEIEHGVEMTFAGTDATLDRVAEFVRKESDCCQFATFEVVVEPPYERTRLSMTAPADGPNLAMAFVESHEAYGDARPST